MMSTSHNIIRQMFGVSAIINLTTKWNTSGYSNIGEPPISTITMSPYDLNDLVKDYQLYLEMCEMDKDLAEAAEVSLNLKGELEWYHTSDFRRK